MKKFPVNDKDRKVLFLDINGVLEPVSEEKTPGKTMDGNLTGLIPDAVKNLETILHGTGEEVELILIVSNPEKDPEGWVRALFLAGGIGEYVTSFCSYNDVQGSNNTIDRYLEEHSGLFHYVVVSKEKSALERFPFRSFCMENGCFTKYLANQIRRVFEYGFWWQYRPLEAEDFFNDYYDSVIFLDIDGVLNYYSGKNWVEDSMAAILKKEIVDPTKAEIVITSSWRDRLCGWAFNGFPQTRDYQDCLELVRVFRDNKIMISDMTPRIRSGPDGRPFEIRLWLAHHHGIKNFVILDDEPFWKWGWLNKYVVQTAEYPDDGKAICGLNHNYADRARAILLENDAS